MNTRIPIFDTHQHLIYPEKHPCSWTGGIPELAGKAFRYDDYLKAVEDAGITKTIFMETATDDPYWQDEIGFVRSLSNKPGSLIKGIIVVAGPSRGRDLKLILNQCSRRNLWASDESCTSNLMSYLNDQLL